MDALVKTRVRVAGESARENLSSMSRTSKALSRINSFFKTLDRFINNAVPRFVILHTLTMS